MDDARGGKPRAGVLHDPEAAKFGAGQRADAMGHAGGKPYRLVGRDDEGTTGYGDGEQPPRRDPAVVRCRRLHGNPFSSSPPPAARCPIPLPAAVSPSALAFSRPLPPLSIPFSCD